MCAALVQPSQPAGQGPMACRVAACVPLLGFRHRAWQAFRGPAEHSPESASLCQAAGERPRGLCRALSEQIDAVARLQGASPEPAGADAGAAAAAELHSSLREVLWCLRPDDKASPWGDSCLEVAGLLLAADVPARLVGCLPLLGFEARKDASRVFTALLRAGASLEAEIARNLRSSPRLLRMLLEGCGDAEVFFHCSQMLRACAGEQGLLEALHQEAAADTLIALAQHPSFDISSEAFASLRVLMLGHREASASYLEANFSHFFGLYHGLLQTEDYATRRQALKLLSEILLDRAFMRVMIEYVKDERYLQLHMNLLRDSSKAIRMEAFQVFKIFAANPNKPRRVQIILHRNRDRLVQLLGALRPKEDDSPVARSQGGAVFERDLATVVKLLGALELPSKVVSPQASGKPC